MTVELESQTKESTEILEPPMYQVVILNDDFTPMDFVMEVLIKVFNQRPQQAMTLMYDVHEKGKGIAGIYSKPIAKTKIQQVKKMAEHEGHPLSLEMEPVHQSPKPRMTR